MIQKYKIIHGKVDRLFFIHVFRNNNRFSGEEGLLTEDEGRSMDLQISKHAFERKHIYCHLKVRLILTKSTCAFG